MAELTPSEPAPAPRKGRGCALALVLCVLILVGGGVAVYWLTLRQTERTVEGIKKGLQEGFMAENISETFTTSFLDARSTNGAILEVATATATENFERKTNLTLWNTALPLGTTSSEISVPATYRYHVRLDEPWEVSVSEGDAKSVVVIVPPVKPSLPVAFDTAKMKKRTESGWARWDGDTNLEELEATITERLAKRASSPPHIDKARDAARQSVAAFVKNWLLTEEHWRDDRFTQIKVLFADELDETSPEEAPPTLSLQPPGDAPAE